MRWTVWLQIVIVLQARCFAQAPTICSEEPCRCIEFTRIICNCTENYELTLRPDGAYRVPRMTNAIIIHNCARVYFLEDTVRNLTELRNIELRNVDDVVIKQRALSWSPFRRSDLEDGLRILIDNSTVNEIASYAIQGSINDIRIMNSRINNIRPYAFSSLTNVNNIELTNNIYDNVQLQAFKKFTMQNFLIRGGTAGTLPSRFLSDVEVINSFRVEGLTVHSISSSTFLVTSPSNVHIESNNIDTLEGDSFRIITRGPLTFRNNTVTNLVKGAFFGFATDPVVLSNRGAQELLIDNNTISNLSPSALMYDKASIKLRVDGLNLNVTCSCELADEWQEMLQIHGGTITCWYSLEGYFASLPTYVDSRCGAFKQTFWMFVAIGIVLVLIIAAIVIFLLVRCENKKKKKHQIVMPDGKTYKETEFHIVLEKAELLTTDL